MAFLLLLHWFAGYVAFTASGGFPERFVNLCAGMRIPSLLAVAAPLVRRRTPRLQAPERDARRGGVICESRRPGIR